MEAVSVITALKTSDRWRDTQLGRGLADLFLEWKNSTKNGEDDLTPADAEALGIELRILLRNAMEQ